ncbi:hypothetical protein [Bartonella sp. AU55XJBT]|uniref:hypothetical protein n=1 Tax=Bartonella sp. AU55XJBT TaxID=3019091 RepID=UPI003857EC1E
MISPFDPEPNRQLMFTVEDDGGHEKSNFKAKTGLGPCGGRTAFVCNLVKNLLLKHLLLGETKIAIPLSKFNINQSLK